MLDGEDFAALTDPFRAELLAHCYRMLGSVQDAEDQVQETLIRAWRSYGEFEGRSSLRTWLYRIATNACLRALENNSRRPLPSGLGAPADDPTAPPAAGQLEIPWLQPMPDVLVSAGPADPAAIVTARTSMRLALIAALQYLPPRQRAVLILRDVLQWRAAEVAKLLGTTTIAVNAMLQRARARLSVAAPAEDDIHEPASPEDRALANRYAAAFENADIAALTELLRADAVFEMPPLPTWFAGRAAMLAFLQAQVLRDPGHFRLLPTTANGQPAFATYMREADGVHRAHGILVLTIAASHVTRSTMFLDPTLLTTFGLPPTLPATGDPPEAPDWRPAETPAPGR
jgi:RNA polymerase sigma-70 factor (ECF subfamily)